MFGFTSSGCFLAGIFVGFAVAFLVAIACLFYFNPNIKNQVIPHIEQVWNSIKSGVDSSIDTVKKAPVAEPSLKPVAAVPQPSGSNVLSPQMAPAHKSAKTAPAQAARKQGKISPRR